MKTKEIHDALSKLLIPSSVLFLGVVPKDLVPDFHSVTRVPACIVVNTDPSTKPGEHWVAVYRESPNSIEFFDSYGLPPEAYNFSFSATHFNTKCIQSLNSSVCGHYVIYYLYLRMLGHSLNRIQSAFSVSDLKWNDQQVLRWIKKHVGTSRPSLSISHEIHQSCHSRVGVPLY